MKSKLFRILGVVAVVAMLATSIVAPVAAITTPTLGVSGAVAPALSTDISTAGINYTVTFTTGLTNNASTSGIVVTFDSGINVAGITGVTITTGGGLGTTPYAAQAITFGVAGQVVTLDTTSINNTNVPSDAGNIGAGAVVQLVFAGVTNPATIGNFGVTVKTAAETTAVASNQITTTAPAPVALPGVITVVNSAGLTMTSTNDFATALAYLTTNSLANATISLTAGTYASAFPSNALAVTIQGTDADPTKVILKTTGGAWTLSGATVVINKLTIDNTTASLNLNSAAGTISNSTLKGGPVNLQGAANTIDTCNVVVPAAKTGLFITGVSTVKNSTFSLANSTTSIGISSSVKVTVSGSTFTGTTGNGVGVALTAGAGSTIGTSKFTGLTSAFVVSGGAAGTFSGNTVDVSGIATTGPSTIEIGIGGNGVVSITGNTITNSLYYILNVDAAGTGNAITMMNNTFKGNAKNIANASATAVNATHNFWSGAAVPADVTTAPNLATYNPAVGAAPTAAAFGAPAAITGAFDASAAGVKFVASTGPQTFLSAAVLGANPVAVALPTTVTLKRYFDVFAVGGTAASTYTVDFFGATGAAVGATDAIYFYNAGTGQWLPASSQTVNAFGGYVEITISSTPPANTAPSAVQFSGLPFALVTINPVAPPVVVPGSASTPAQAATGVDVNTSFIWTAVAGADHYDFVLAEDLGTTNKFDIIDYSLTTPVNGAASKETLKYNTIYWWRVRSVSAAGVASAWTNYFFTTEDVPPVVTTTTPPVITTIVTSVVVTQPPAVTTIVTTTGLTITNTQTTTQAIPSYLLWAVIAVGAILVISVIVLIVRTRKI